MFIRVWLIDAGLDLADINNKISLVIVGFSRVINIGNQVKNDVVKRAKLEDDE